MLTLTDRESFSSLFCRFDVSLSLCVRVVCVCWGAEMCLKGIGAVGPKMIACNL